MNVDIEHYERVLIARVNHRTIQKRMKKYLDILVNSKEAITIIKLNDSLASPKNKQYY